MKYLFFPLVFLMFSCAESKQAQESFTRNLISQEEQNTLRKEITNDSLIYAVPELDSSKVDPYFDKVQLLSHHKRNKLEQFIKTILVAEDDILKVIKEDSLIRLYLRGEYFNGASNMSFSWRYYYFHDIYSSFFVYPEIQTVLVYQDGKNITQLPASGDNDPLYVPDGVERTWYSLNVDYIDYISWDDERSFSDYEKGIVSISRLHEIKNQ